MSSARISSLARARLPLDELDAVELHTSSSMRAENGGIGAASRPAMSGSHIRCPLSPRWRGRDEGRRVVSSNTGVTTDASGKCVPPR